MKKISKGAFMSDSSYLFAEESYAQRIHSYYPNMSSSEKKIADYITGNSLAEINDLTINEMASNIGTSTSTIVRFCRNIGFKSYSEFRFFLQKLPQGVSNDEELLNAAPNASAIKDKVISLVNSSVASTVMTMDNACLEEAIDAISNSTTVVFWGLGTASGVAQAAAASFVNMGIHAISYTDCLTARRSIHFLGDKDVVVVINRNGRFVEGLNIVELALKRGVKTIAITEDPRSDLAEIADIVLLTAINDRQLPIMLPCITLCQHLTIQLLQVGVLLRKYDELRDIIEIMYGVTDIKGK